MPKTQSLSSISGRENTPGPVLSGKVGPDSRRRPFLSLFFTQPKTGPFPSAEASQGILNPGHLSSGLILQVGRLGLDVPSAVVSFLPTRPQLLLSIPSFSSLCSFFPFLFTPKSRVWNGPNACWERPGRVLATAPGVCFFMKLLMSSKSPLSERCQKPFI